MSRDISWFVDFSGAFKGCVVVQGQRVAICSYDNARRQAWGSSSLSLQAAHVADLLGVVNKRHV